MNELITEQPGVTIETDPYEGRAERGRQAWKRFWLRLQAITPASLMRGVLATGAAAFLVWAAVASWPALLPFVVGLAVAYVLLPTVNAFDRVMPRPLASLIVVGGFFLIVVLLIAAFLRPIVEQLDAIVIALPPAGKFQGVIDQLMDSLRALPPPVTDFVRGSLEARYAAFQAQGSDVIRKLLLLGLGTIFGLFRSLGFILGLFVVPAWLLSVINSYGQAVRATNRVLPEWMRPDALAVVRIIHRTLRSFLRVQVVTVIAVSVIMYLAILLVQRMGLVDLRYPVVNAVFPAVMQLIPVLGVFLGALPALINLLFVSPASALTLLVIYLGALWLANLLFIQREQSRVVDLHGGLLAVVLVVLSAFGPLWVLLSLPMARIARDLFRYVYGRFGEPPRPAGVLPGEPLPGTAQSNQRVPLVYRRSRRGTRTGKQAA